MKLIFPGDKLIMDMIKKSYWIQREHLFDPVEYVCSVCGAASEGPWEECPECGAKMKKGNMTPSMWTRPRYGIFFWETNEMSPFYYYQPLGKSDTFI